MNVKVEENKLSECRKSQFLLSSFGDQSQDYAQQLNNYGQTINKFIQSKNFSKNSTSRDKYASNMIDESLGHDKLRIESACEVFNNYSIDLSMYYTIVTKFTRHLLSLLKLKKLIFLLAMTV